MIKKKKCFQCKEEFEYDPKGRFTRKYCKKCGVERKKRWDNQWRIKFEDLDDE